MLSIIRESSDVYMMRCVFAALAFMSVNVGAAQETSQEAVMDDVTVRAIISGDGIQPSPRSMRRDGALTETIFISGQRVRLDFDDGNTMRGTVLRDGDEAGIPRLLSRHAFPAEDIRIGRLARLPTERPCWNQGFTYHRVEDRLLAGRRASGGRNRHAGQDGPFGTDQGTYWVDAETGVMLGYDSNDLAGHRDRMRAIDVE